MATIKTKFRPSKVAERAGTIFYQVTHKRKTAQTSTGIRIMPDAWDSKNNQVKALKDLFGTIVRDRINADLRSIKHIIQELEKSGEPYTAHHVVELFRRHSSDMSFLNYMREQIDIMRSLGKNGTATNYQSTLRSFSSFLCGEDITFSELTKQLIGMYGIWLGSRVTHNSVSFYMRNLRAIFNKAVEQELVDQTYPFKKVYTGVDKTRKRAVDENTIKELHKLNLQCEKKLALARDMFIFSYCAMGMAFVDMAYLQKSDIQGDHIVYARHKTGQILCVKVNTRLSKIINRYQCYSDKHIFPIIKSTSKNLAYKEYRNGLNEYNRLLRILSGRLTKTCHLSSYTSRHSWATNAQRNHNTPISVISASLGHTTEKTTRIYLASLENSVIDNANEEIISILDEWTQKYISMQEIRYTCKVLCDNNLTGYITNFLIKMSNKTKQMWEETKDTCLKMVLGNGIYLFDSNSKLFVFYHIMPMFF